MKTLEFLASKYIFIFLLSLLFLPVAASAQTGFSILSDGDDDQLYTINLQTGDVNAIGPTGFDDIECLTFNLRGTTLFGVNGNPENGELVTCDPDTGNCTEVGPLGVSIDTCGLAFDCNGDLFLSQGGADVGTFYSVDPETGVATENW